MQISQPAREEERIVLAEPPMSATQRSVSELARDKPDVVAGLIGKWIEEDR